MIQGAAGELGIPVPTAIVGSTDPSAVLFFQLAKREGKELSTRHDWQSLIVQQTFTSTATVVQATALPADYDHLVPDVELWNRSQNMLLAGPTPSDIWARLQSGITGGVAGYWRIVGGDLNIFPAPTAGQTYAFEYLTKNWCASSGGTAQATWAADADVGVIDEDLMQQGLIWRWLRAKGMDYAQEQETYESAVGLASARDRGIQIMTLGGRRMTDPPYPYWAGTITP